MTHSILKRITLMLAMVGFLGLLAGCNTMEGLGQDTQEAGEAIEDKAADHND
ncbi:MAG: entericidin A/B family lipoprotein [Pseudomonadota bacterium]